MGSHESKNEIRDGYEEKKTKRKRLLPVTKRGGFLPILPMLGALGSLIGGAASVARAVSDRRQTEGRGLYLAPYKRGSGGNVRKRKAKGKKKHDGKKR